MKFSYEELQILEKFAKLEWTEDYEIGDLFIKKDGINVLKIDEGISLNSLMSLWSLLYYKKNKLRRKIK